MFPHMFVTGRSSQDTLMQHLTFVVLEVCLATRGRAIHLAHTDADQPWPVRTCFDS
jgi:hypothetical protein